VDSFNLGKPSRGPNMDARTLVLAGIVIVAVLSLIVLYLQFVGRSGKEVASDQATVVQQVDRAQDVQAKLNARIAESAASAAFQASNGYATVGPDQLSLLDPTLTYTTGPSTSVNVVSVASSQAAWAAAILGPSGTCYYVKLAAMGLPAYGTGTACTGAAAMAASNPSW
jgi:type II secretory pathway pseudopilin PulG